MNAASFALFWKSILLPGGIALALGLIAWAAFGRSTAGEKHARLLAFLGSLSVLAGSLAAFVALMGWPADFPPPSSWQWIFYISMASMAVAAVGAFVPAETLMGQGLRWGARVFFAGFAVGAVFWKKVLEGQYQFVPWVAIALALVASWPWERAERRGLRGFFMTGALASWAGTVAVIILLEHTARLSQIGGTMACALAGLLLPAALAKRLPGAVAAWLPMWLAALCAVAYWSTDSTNAAGFILVGLAPLALVLWPPASPEAPLPRRELLRRIGALALYGLALLGALGFTWADSARQAKDDPYGSYYGR